MKKNSLLLLLITLLIPCFVSADMGMPETKEYDVVVTKKGGADLIDYQDKVAVTVPYEETLTITYEEYQKGTLYGYTSYKDKYGRINLDDVAIKDDKFNIEDYQWYYEPGEIYIIKKGAKLYKGPAFKYGYVDENMEIEEGTTLKYKYRDEQWAYVSYEGKTGWIYDYNYFLDEDQEIYTARKAEKDETVYFIKDTKMYSSPKIKDELETSIPKFTELDVILKVYTESKSSVVYVEYNGTKGWIDTGMSYPNENSGAFSLDNYDDLNALTTYKMQSKLISSKEITIYKDLSLNEKIGSIKQNNEFTQIYYFIGEKTPTYVNVNGVKGWAILDEENNQIANKDEGEILAIEKINVYNSPNKSQAAIGTLNENEEVKKVYYLYANNGTYYYIESPSIKGWISPNYSDYATAYESKVELINDVNIFSKPNKYSEKAKKIIEKGTELEVKYSTYKDGTSWYYVDYKGIQGWIDQSMAAEIEPEIEEPEPEDKPHVIKDKEKEDKKEEKLSTMQIALIGVGAAAVLAVTAIITIVTIKKKKAKKNAIKTEEVKPEETAEVKEETKEVVEEQKEETSEVEEKTEKKAKKNKDEEDK